MAETNTNVNTNGDNTTNTNGDGNQNTQQNINTNSQNTNTNTNAVDTEKVKNDAIAEYLKELGVEDGDTLKGIVTKAKEEEEKIKRIYRNQMILLQLQQKNLSQNVKHVSWQKQSYLQFN